MMKCHECITSGLRQTVKALKQSGSMNCSVRCMFEHCSCLYTCKLLHHNVKNKIICSGTTWLIKQVPSNDQNLPAVWCAIDSSSFLFLEEVLRSQINAKPNMH